MNKPSLETLTAYVDGELDDTRRREAEEAIRIDSTLRGTVDRLRASRVMLSTAFAAVIDAPVPARLVQTLESPPHPANVFPLRTAERVSRSWMPLALVASVSLTVGLLVGFIVADSEPAASSETTADLLQRALETLPTGSALTSSDGQAVVTTLSSFRVQDGRICREFEQRATALLSTGIACRNPVTTAWQTQIQVATSQNLSDGNAGERYSPASGSLDPLGWVFDQLGAAPAFDAAEEAELIAKHWQD